MKNGFYEWLEHTHPEFTKNFSESVLKLIKIEFENSINDPIAYLIKKKARKVGEIESVIKNLEVEKQDLLLGIEMLETKRKKIKKK